MHPGYHNVTYSSASLNEEIKFHVRITVPFTCKYLKSGAMKLTFVYNQIPKFNSPDNVESLLYMCKFIGSIPNVERSLCRIHAAILQKHTM